MSLLEYIKALKKYKGFAGDIVCHREYPPEEASHAKGELPFAHGVEPLLKSLGIEKLFTHQAQAMAHILDGRHTVVATPTASGKSLIYNLPVVDQIRQDPASRALYLFPLKALARDQLNTVEKFLRVTRSLDPKLPKLWAGVYDGDITAYQKTKIRKSPPQVLLSNPEMLHLAMLAHH
ncbi:MAG: DEAD/DEAH box helicase, partial [Desulfovibrionales bacterium]|nr:DEAD/DEAH box helicase [Desulfovibrionales bacterium]